MMKNYFSILVAAMMLLGLQVCVNPLAASNLGSANAADGYVLTVTGGTGSGSYASAAVVDIVADPAPSGMVFDRWVLNDGNPVIDSIYKATIKLTMPSTAVAITALYMPDGPYFDNCDAVLSWTNSQVIKPFINTVNMVQGTGCLETTLLTTSSTMFQILYATPISTSATIADGSCRFRFWIEDASKLGSLLSIELRSGTEAAAEHQWNVPKASVVNGWNNFNLKFTSITLSGSNLGVDLAAVNWFRAYSSGCTVGIHAKLDGLMVYNPTITKVDPQLTWAKPADVVTGSALSSIQLNATSNIAGTFTYTPASGAITTEGINPLSVTFKPSMINAFIYNEATKAVDLTAVAATALDQTTTSDFGIYPNLLKKEGVLTIQAKGQDRYTLKIISMNGQVVYNHQLNGSQALNVNGILKQGAYMVSLVSNQSTVNQKLIIQ